MKRPDLITDERSATNGARLANVEWVEEQICAWTTQHTRAEIMEALDGGIPAGPVQNMEDIYRDPHIAARQMLERNRLVKGTCRRASRFVYRFPIQAGQDSNGVHVGQFALAGAHF